MSIITATEHFIFQTEITDPLKYSAARRQAVAVASTCEADLAKLEDWFGVSGPFGSSNIVNVIITDLDYGLGNNNGYHATQANTIRIIPFNALLIPHPPGRMDYGGEASRAVFVAELAELLMGCRNHRISDNTLKGAVSWDPTNSMGEALSTVCEALLHPNGYYGPHIQGPRIDWWLNYSSFTTDGSRLTIRRNWRRPNYVDRTDNTDRNDVSYGCGIVFIYYLMWLGYSMKGIIASGGATLEETYKNLTGRSGGWKAMTDLLNLYLPERPVWSYWPSRDNLFPLPGLTAITLSPDSVVAGDSSIGTATLDAPSDGNIIISLFSSAPGFATVTSEVSISVGSTVGTFVVSTCPSSETLRQEAA